MFNRLYALDGKNPVRVTSVEEWGRLMKDMLRHVALTERGGIRVSTVFLGLDHSFSDDGPPVLFETMVFGGPMDGEQRRCGTWEEAEKQHDEVVAAVWAAGAKDAEE